MSLSISKLYFFHLRVSRDKSTAVPVHDMQVWRGVEVLPHSFLTSALNGGKRPDSCPGRFTTAKRVARQRSPLNRPWRPRGGVNYSSTLSLTSALDRGDGQRHAPTALPPGMTRYQLYTRLGAPPGRSGGSEKSRPYWDSMPGPSPESLYRLRYPYSRISPPMALYLTPGMVTRTPKAQRSFSGTIPAHAWYQHTQGVQLGQSAYAGLARLISCRVVTLNLDFKSAVTWSNVTKILILVPNNNRQPTIH
jgi:hypothetical protein